MAGTEDEKGEEDEEGRGILEETSTTGRAGNIRANAASLITSVATLFQCRFTRMEKNVAGCVALP